MSSLEVKNADMLGLDRQQVWDVESAFKHLEARIKVRSKRAATDRLKTMGMLPPTLDTDSLRDELGRPGNSVVANWAIARARGRRNRVLFISLSAMPNGCLCLRANDAHRQRYWVPLPTGHPPSGETLICILEKLKFHIGRPITVFPHGSLVEILRKSELPNGVSWHESAYLSTLNVSAVRLPKRPLSPHLQRLENESIHIIREAIAEAERPVMLYSIGKDSSALLHLARKAFYPSLPPFPLLHVDTRWKFHEMYMFREHIATVSGMEFLVHVNPEAIERDINPYEHGSTLHTYITKTEGLKQALEKHRFDIVLGGARRDEEQSRAKERIFSYRNSAHRWDPKQQRPEFWNLYNTRKNEGESIRAFPLSNWTELDVWQYIYHEDIAVVPLYFSKKRAVIQRDGLILAVDDSRFRLQPGDKIKEKHVRFRTLGCYPLTGAIESNATTLSEIILEIVNSRDSERQGRAIDKDQKFSMEKKKQEGYF